MRGPGGGKMARHAASSRTGMPGEDKNKLRLVYMNVSQLKKWENNPKDHDIEAIKASIVRFGFKGPPPRDNTAGLVPADNGRAEPLERLKAGGKPPPQNIEVRGGEWYAPVLIDAGFLDRGEAE